MFERTPRSRKSYRSICRTICVPRYCLRMRSDPRLVGPPAAYRALSGVDIELTSKAPGRCTSPTTYTRTVRNRPREISTCSF